MGSGGVVRLPLELFKVSGRYDCQCKRRVAGRDRTEEELEIFSAAILALVRWSSLLMVGA